MDEKKKSRYTPAQNIATQKYIKNNYDELKIRLEKGKRAILKQYADNADESVNSYIKRAIIARIKADTGEDIDL